METIKQKIRGAHLFTFMTDVQKVSAKQWILMDPIEGPTLRELLAEKILLLEKEAVFYLTEIASALHVLHENHIVYRDLKPDNVMIKPNGHAALCDFGLCEKFDTETMLYNVCGTLGYIAPEIFSGTGYTYKVDWWSFGVLFFEMLTGRLPFDIVTVKTVSETMLQKEIACPCFISEDAYQLLRVLLCKNPSLRATWSDIQTHPWWKLIQIPGESSEDFWTRCLEGQLIPPITILL